MQNMPAAIGRKQTGERGCGREQNQVDLILIQHFAPARLAVCCGDISGCKLLTKEIASAIDEDTLAGISGPEQVIAPLVRGEDSASHNMALQPANARLGRQ